METRVDEIADGISRLSTVPDAAPGPLSFNQFVVKADESLLFQCGQRQSSVSSLPRVRSPVQTPGCSAASNDP
jgi:hypothetical protein